MLANKRLFFAALCVVASATAVRAAATLSESAPALEQALAMNLDGSARDAVIFRMEDGDGMAIFAPTAAGGFELRVFPGLGPDVEGIYQADADADGRDDLVVRRIDGSFSPWLSDGRGGLLPEALIIAPTHPGAHHHVEPSDAERQAQHAQDALHATLDARLRRGDAASTRAGDPVRFDATGALPAGFRARAVAFGRFGPQGEPGVAVVGQGSRPRLAVILTTPGGKLDAQEMFSPTTTFNVTVASGGFNFAPSTVNIQAGDTVHWTWAGSGHTVTSGDIDTCVVNNTFCSPSNTSCATAALSNVGATYDRIFPAAGSFDYFCRPHCGFGMVGTVNVAAAPTSPGSVPDGDAVAGVPLKLGKGVGGTLDLTWSNSCAVSATNYAVYEGTLPLTGTYNHAALNCALGNTNAANIAPGAGDRYYLLVPETATNDGSYGLDWIGGVRHEIPAAAAPCHPRLLAACP